MADCVGKLHCFFKQGVGDDEAILPLAPAFGKFKL